ncbi:MAG TPA: DUF192 domain-containing protein [Burkholderiales bacterium]|nr:DUF192 domain-containing protein [Burkholderiales bacterium]
MNKPAVLAAAALAAASSALAQMPVVQLVAGMYLIRAEVANTLDTRATGLMFRKSLAPNEGMLFVFPEAEMECMWMKNTLIPLSVAFIDASGAIVSISEMQPQTETTHCAARPAKYALEMNRGWFASKGLRAGTVIRGLDKAPLAR